MARFSLVFLFTLTLAVTPPVASGPSLEAPMTFSFYQPCDGSGYFCGQYILAQGTITQDTPRQLEAVLRAQKFKPRIFFHSPGGNLIAGMELGNIIRRLRFDTYVGGPYENVFQLGQPPKIIITTGVCLSACAYAFLGGVSRELNAGGQYGVHQFSGSTKDLGQSAAQVATAAVAQYLDEMGVDRRLLDIASITAPGSVQIIPVQLARELNVDNTDPPKRAWDLRPDENGNLSLLVAQRQPRRDGVAFLAFHRNGDYLLGTLIYRIRQNFRSFLEMNEIFKGPTPFNLTANERHYQTTTVSSWDRLSVDSFRIRIAVTQSALLELSRVATFGLDARWPNANIDVDPSTEFGTEGLRNGVLALLK